MHAPPPYQITVRQFGVWRMGCSALVMSSLLATVVWAEASLRVHPGWLLFSIALWAVASIALLFHAARLAATSLRWDGQVWHCGPAATVGQEPRAGHLYVASDLGNWMLLRFVAEGARRPVWLPAQRRGHELAWHGLRATVYCARPVSMPTAAPF
jgi:hypothetical protein